VGRFSRATAGSQGRPPRAVGSLTRHGHRAGARDAKRQETRAGFQPAQAWAGWNVRPACDA
jgi:hypothetical protein